MEIKQNTIDGLVAMTHCEVVEIRNSADADGFPCSRTASTQCFDCGSELCESHTETCGICNGIFCPSCLSFHSVQHSKPASADHGERRERKRLRIRLRRNSLLVRLPFQFHFLHLFICHRHCIWRPPRFASIE